MSTFVDESVYARRDRTIPKGIVYDASTRESGSMMDREKRSEVPTSETSDAVRTLLLQIRSAEGSEHSGFDALMELYLQLNERTVELFSAELGSDTDRDDVRQEALMGLYRAALSFDLSQDKVSFGLYAQICMTNRMVSYMRAYNKRKEAELREVPEELCSDETVPAFLEEERIRCTYEVIRRLLSPFEYTIWCHYVGAASVREIAQAVGKSEKSVSNAITRIRKKLRDARAEFDF